MRTVKAKKSKYYGIALAHMRKAKKLYSENNREDEWLSLVEGVRRDHYRKNSFIGDFERTVLGSYPEHLESFEERTRKRWKDNYLISKRFLNLNAIRARFNGSAPGWVTQISTIDENSITVILNREIQIR